MRVATIYSVCECQARLGAEVDEQLRVSGGHAIGGRQRTRAVAPANRVGGLQQAARAAARFSVGWQCPFCGRNTLRSFAADALAWRTAPTPEAPVADSPAAG